tara:strand:+ start:98 stop:583 length:486 start_codon:yes stop_codon:yes gene_type:complete
MSNLVNKIINILTAGRTVTDKRIDQSGVTTYDIACNGTYIWFFTSSPQDDRFDPKSGNLRFLTAGVDVDIDELTVDEQVELTNWIASNGHEWRCKDGDGELHGRGYYYGDDDESLFAPQEFIQWNTGATTIEIRERKYKLIEAEDGTVSLEKDGIKGWSYV